MPFNACGNCPAANAVIGLIYVPCAVAAAMSAACCCNEENTFFKTGALTCTPLYYVALATDNYFVARESVRERGKCPPKQHWKNL